MSIEKRPGSRDPAAARLFAALLIAFTCSGLAISSARADQTGPWIVVLSSGSTEGYLYNQTTGETWRLSGNQRQRVTDYAAPVANKNPVEVPRVGSISPVTDLDINSNGPNETTASIRYVNDSDRTFRQVSIACRALDSEGYYLADNTVPISPGSYIDPGFKTKVTVRLASQRERIKNVVCKVQ